MLHNKAADIWLLENFKKQLCTCLQLVHACFNNHHHIISYVHLSLTGINDLVDNMEDISCLHKKQKY